MESNQYAAYLPEIFLLYSTFRYLAQTEGFSYVQVRDLSELKSVHLRCDARASTTLRLCNHLHSASDVNYVLMEL